MNFDAFSLSRQKPLKQIMGLDVTGRKQIQFLILGKTSIKLPTVWAGGGRLAMMLLHACVCLCTATLWTKMRTLLVVPPLLGKNISGFRRYCSETNYNCDLR